MDKIADIINRAKGKKNGGFKKEQIYHPQTKEELKEIIKSEIERQGENVDLRMVDVSKVEDMGSMFYGCENLKSLNLSGWDTSKVEYMSYMFYGCESLKSLDLSGWDTSKVKNMTDMFDGCPCGYELEGNKIVKLYNNSLW